MDSYLIRIVTLLEEIQTSYDLIEKSLIQLNGYFYLLIFGLAGVGLFLLFYKFIKIFI